jgi:hypothetical protein
MGIRIADVPAMSAKQQLQLLLVVEYLLQMQIMQLKYKRCPNTNPWVDLVQSGRSDFVIAHFS